METVYLVIGWERDEADHIHGVYRNKVDAEYVRDHLIAINFDKRRDNWVHLTSKGKAKYQYPPLTVNYGGYYVEEEVLH